MKLLSLTLIGLIARCAFCADLDARAIVTRSVLNYQDDWKAALDFTYTEHDVTKDTTGCAKTTEVSQIYAIDGTPYTRLIARNGAPLSGDEARRENEKYERTVAARDAETAQQRADRIAKYQQDRAFLNEIPDAFDMKMLPPEEIGGRENYVIRLTPKPGYVPKSRNARLFAYIEGKMWIDQQDLRWTQAEADVIDSIAIGWVLARIGPGAHLALKQAKVEGEHWMVKELDIDGVARIMLVKNHPINETVSYSDFKRVRSPAPTTAAKNQ